MLTLRQRNAIAMMALQTKTDKAVAELVGVSPRTMKKWKVHDKEFIEALAKAKADYEAECQKKAAELKEKYWNDVEEKICKLSDTAVEVYADILEHGEDDRVKAQVAKDVLDRCGHRPSDKLEISGLDDQKNKLDDILSQLRE